MFLKQLKISNLRNLERVALEPHPRFNVLYGGNGAGKTSVLEAIVVLSRGRSFRTTQAIELIGQGDSSFRVYAEAVSDGQNTSRIGIERSGRHWRGRKDGSDLAQLSQLTRTVPLMLMEPNSHLLVSGSPEVRRKFLDWGMFHVEHGFLETFRNFAKALKQRNAALRQGREQVLDSIDEVFCDWSEKLDRMRKDHCAAVSGRVVELLPSLSGGLESFGMEYRQGWSKSSLREALKEHRQSDMVKGSTSSGPHRGEINLSMGETAARNVLSRGEQKMLAAALLFSQAAILAEAGETPLILLDDLASEFDEAHFNRVIDMAMGSGGQVWLTGVQLRSFEQPRKVFHVERGSVQEVV